MTPEQQKALTLARVRLRMKAKQQGSGQDQELAWMRRNKVIPGSGERQGGLIQAFSDPMGTAKSIGESFGLSAGEKGTFLPISRDEQGGRQFDSDAGLVGVAKRAVTLPYDVLRGNVQMTDPTTGRTSDEAIGRGAEFAGTLTPTAVPLRSGANLMTPGVGRNVKQSATPIPTPDELKAAGSAGFDAMRATGATYPTRSTGRMADITKAELENLGIDPMEAPSTFNVLEKIINPGEGVEYAGINNLHTARKRLGKIGQNFNNPTEQKAASSVIEALDKFISGQADVPIPPVSPTAARTGAVGGTIQARKQAGEALAEANANYSAGERGKFLDKAIDEDAAMQAEANASGQNIGNAYRQKVKAALRNEKKVSGYNQQEKDALRNVVRGTKAANRTRSAGNFLGGGGGLGALVTTGAGGYMGSMFGGPAAAGVGAALGATVLPAAGRTLKNVSNKITKKQFDDAKDMVLKRSPLYQKAAKNPKMEFSRSSTAEAIIRALIAGQGQYQQ